MTSVTALNSNPIGHIAICGGGLAGHMVAAALLRHLPLATQITHITSPHPPAADIFYGSVTTPSAYDFNLSMGASEPQLVLGSRTAFSLGTRYNDWGGEKRTWFQGFPLPLPVLNGVEFHQYLIRQQISDLDPFLVSAAAAKRGAFAHPPDNANHPLARAEYGYQFDAAAYGQVFAALVKGSRVNAVVADLAEVTSQADRITALHLSNGQTISADLFIDCTGPEAALLGEISTGYVGDRHLDAALSIKASESLGPAARTLNGHAFGWQSVTPLQGALAKLTVFSPEADNAALALHGEAPDLRSTARFGRQAEAWRGNCVALGQSAAMLEPVTPAPIVLLQKDIGRLMSLIPLSADMSMERREFNRQFVDDYEHAELFRCALFATTPISDSSYWRAQNALPASAKLERKIEQFLSRGALVSYDLEPFTREDWIVLHFGLGRCPRRHDRLADQAPFSELRLYLETMRRDIDTSVASLPSHHTYMTKLQHFLMQEGA